MSPQRRAGAIIDALSTCCRRSAGSAPRRRQRPDCRPALQGRFSSSILLLRRVMVSRRAGARPGARPAVDRASYSCDDRKRHKVCFSRAAEHPFDARTLSRAVGGGMAAPEGPFVRRCRRGFAQFNVRLSRRGTRRSCIPSPPSRVAFHRLGVEIASVRLSVRGPQPW